MKNLHKRNIVIPFVFMMIGIIPLAGCGIENTQKPSPAPPVTTPVEPSPSHLLPLPSQNIAPKPTSSPMMSVTPSPTPSSTVTEKPVETITPSPSPSEKLTDKKALEIEQKSIKTHEPLVRYTITDLNVRSGPGSEYEIIDYLNKGDEIRVDATTEYWQRLEGTDYWVSSGYLNKSKPVDLSKVAEDKQRSALEKLAGKYGCSTATVILDDPRLGSVANAKADWGANSILFRSTSPQSRWDYLMAHECSHLLQYGIYDGNVDKLSSDMNKIYGGVNYEGLEQNSDCFVYAVNPANTQWHYTQECSGKRGEAARAILSGHKPKVK